MQLVYTLVQMLTIITTIIAIIIQIVKRPKLLCTVNKVGMGCKIKISHLLAQNLEECLKFTPYCNLFPYQPFQIYLPKIFLVSTNFLWLLLIKSFHNLKWEVQPDFHQERILKKGNITSFLCWLYFKPSHEFDMVKENNLWEVLK